MHERLPESTSDFERLLLGSPNSSYIWIRYISYLLQLSDLDAARDIARKALQTIHFREDKEKFNIWIAMLNMESSFGTKDSLEAVFKEAVKANEPKTIYLKLASILDQARKIEVIAWPLKLMKKKIEAADRRRRHFFRLRSRSLGPVAKFGFSLGSFSIS